MYFFLFLVCLAIWNREACVTLEKKKEKKKRKEWWFEVFDEVTKYYFTRFKKLVFEASLKDVLKGLTC